MNRIGSDLINSEQELLEVMTRPNSLLIDSINNINGDIMLLGAGGKMGLSLATLNFDGKIMVVRYVDV